MTELGEDNITLQKGKQSALAKAVKKVKKGKAKIKDDLGFRGGIIMLKHIPHGFYEKEMKSYFSQFGKVRRVRVARSLKTGKSRGHAYVEFEFEEVAKIAAESMNNYLMFERLIKCELLPPNVNRRKLFKNSYITETKNPKTFARRKCLKEQDKQLSEEEARDILNQRMQKLKEQNKRLAELGINYSFPVRDDEQVEEQKTSEISTPATSVATRTSSSQKKATPNKVGSQGKSASKRKLDAFEEEEEDEHKYDGITGLFKSPHVRQATPQGKAQKKDTPQAAKKISQAQSASKRKLEVLEDEEDKYDGMTGLFKSPHVRQTTPQGKAQKKGTPQAESGHKKKINQAQSASKRKLKDFEDDEDKYEGISGLFKSPHVAQATPQGKKSKPSPKVTPQKKENLKVNQKQITPESESDDEKYDGIPELLKTPEFWNALKKSNQKKKTPEKPKFSPKLLRSRKSVGPQQTPTSNKTSEKKTKTPGKPDKVSELPKISPKLLRSRARKSEAAPATPLKETTSPKVDKKQKGQNQKTPAKKADAKTSDLPKISPKLLRSRKSDAAGLTPMKEKISTPMKAKKGGRKSMI